MVEQADQSATLDAAKREKEALETQLSQLRTKAEESTRMIAEKSGLLAENQEQIRKVGETSRVCVCAGPTYARPPRLPGVVCLPVACGMSRLRAHVACMWVGWLVGLPRPRRR